MNTALRGLVVVVLFLAMTAWPCSAGPCSRGGGLVTIDGGVPINLFPLAITDLDGEFSLATVELAQLHAVDGGSLATQVRAVDRASLLIDTPVLIEGERYLLDRSGGCSRFGDAGTYHHEFTVVPPVALLTGGVQLEVVDAGFGDVRVYSSGPCSVSTTGTVVSFAYQVAPSAVPLLPFYAWRLSLRPVDGGAEFDWRTEAIGGLLADGSLRELPGPDTATPRITSVFHQCGPGGDQPRRDAPPGRYRAVLSARLLASDAGFVEVSDEFELAACPVDAGVADAGSMEERRADAGVVDAGVVEAADGGGPSATPPMGCGCGEGSSAAVLFLAVCLLRRRCSQVDAQ